MNETPQHLVWRRSSFCADGSCAEVATDGQFVYLRNSREPGEVIALDLDEWAALKAGIRSGEF